MNVKGHVGPGWESIVQRAVDSLERSGVNIFQVKEKFGGLRIYTDRWDEEVGQVISDAEKVCAETCEECGKPGQLRNHSGWLKTQCDDCVGPGDMP